MIRHFEPWLAAAAWMALIFGLSAQPDLPMPGITWLDELLRVAGHFGEYAVLGFLASRAISTGQQYRLRPGVALILCAAYALSDEWHQSLVPGRDASWLDWTIDLCGSFAGIVICRLRSGRLPGI